MTFRDNEKARYEIVKHLLLPADSLLPGHYKDVPRSLPYCLADGKSSNNLHEQIREEAIRYFTDRQIGWHDGISTPDGRPKGLPSNHLCCSQSACVNTLAPMLRDGELLARTFRTFIPEIAEVMPFSADDPLTDGTQPFIAFEWIGIRNYLGEWGWGTRGEYCTSADFAFRFRRYDGRIHVVLGEWKYTEFCDDRSINDDERKLRKRLPVYNSLFQKWSLSRTNLPEYGAFFYEPFFQLMRLSLLAQEMQREREMDADVVTVMHVSPSANADFASSFTSPPFRKLGSSVTTAWASLQPPQHFTAVSVESVLTQIELVTPISLRPWSDWLLQRYGWWRSTTGSPKVST